MKLLKVPDRLLVPFIQILELGMLAARRGEIGWTKPEKDAVSFVKKLIKKHQK